MASYEWGKISFCKPLWWVFFTVKQCINVMKWTDRQTNYSTGRNFQILSMSTQIGLKSSCLLFVWCTLLPGSKRWHVESGIPRPSYKPLPITTKRSPAFVNWQMIAWGWASTSHVSLHILRVPVDIKEPDSYTAFLFMDLFALSRIPVGTCPSATPWMRASGRGQDYMWGEFVQMTLYNWPMLYRLEANGRRGKLSFLRSCFAITSIECGFSWSQNGAIPCKCWA